jgi:hypothetical protein
MQVEIRMGWQPQEDGGFKAIIQWQIGDREPQRRFSNEVYATEADAMGQAEYMGRMMLRIADAMGYEAEKAFDVSPN